MLGSDFMKSTQNKDKKDVKEIKYKVSKLEKVFKLSDNETIANAIRDVLLRDKENEKWN